MNRSLVLLACCALVATACEKAGPAPTPTPSASAASGDPKADPETEALFVEFHDSLAKQIQTDARALATRKFKSRAEGEAALSALRPMNVKPRAEFAGPKAKAASAANPQAFGERMAGFARSHPEIVARETARMAKASEPDIAAAVANLQAQFPLDAGVTDAGTTDDASAGRAPTDAGKPDAKN